jgi:hypothetical protein
MVTVVNGWLLAYDNIRVIPDRMSDALCRLATAGAFAARASITDAERSVIHARRPVILNGMDQFERRRDLSVRSVVLLLPPIAPSRRRREADFRLAFQQEDPRNPDQRRIFFFALDLSSTCTGHGTGLSLPCRTVNVQY